VTWALVAEAARRDVQASAIYLLEKRLRRVDRRLRRALTKRETNQLLDLRHRLVRALEAAWRLV
jgi:predicted nucleic acid-binding protein